MVYQTLSYPRILWNRVWSSRLVFVGAGCRGRLHEVYRNVMFALSHEHQVHYILKKDITALRLLVGQMDGHEINDASSLL